MPGSVINLEIRELISWLIPIVPSLYSPNPEINSFIPKVYKKLPATASNVLPIYV